MRGGLVAILFLGWVLSWPALGQGTGPSPAPGPTPAWSIEGKRLPASPGNWVEAGRAEGPDGVVSVALLRVEGQQVTGAMLAQANRRGVPTAWGIAPGCERADLIFAKVRHQSDHSGSCAYVARIDETAPRPASSGTASTAPASTAVASTGGTPQAAAPAGLVAPLIDPAWTSARGLAQSRGWVMPRQWTTLVVRTTMPREAMQLRYAFPDADWRAAFADTPAAAIAAWVEPVWDAVELGLRNRPGVVAALPALGKRFEIAPPAEDAGFTLPRAVWKTITFRLFATGIDFTANLVVIGDPLTAAALSALPIVVGPWVYLGHELAWDRLSPPETRGIALPGLGMETP